MPRGVFVKDILQGCEPCVEVVFCVGLKVVHVGFKGGVLLIAQKLQTFHIGNKIVEFVNAHFLIVSKPRFKLRVECVGVYLIHHARNHAAQGTIKAAICYVCL